MYTYLLVGGGGPLCAPIPMLFIKQLGVADESDIPNCPVIVWPDNFDLTCYSILELLQLLRLSEPQNPPL